MMGDKSYSAPPRGVAWEPYLRRRAKQRGISGLRLAMKVVQASQPTLRGASEVFPTGFPSVRATCLHGRGKCVLSSTFRQFSLFTLIVLPKQLCKCAEGPNCIYIYI